MHNSSGHLAIATGGTGGHFYPALAVAREFQSQGGVATLFIAGQRTEQHIAEARRGGFVAFECRASRLPVGPLNALFFPVKLLLGTLRARTVLKRLGPDFVLGMGSFASVPPCLAASLIGKPLFLHDGNAIVGKANRFLSRRATCMALSLPLAPGQSARCRTQVTGMPVRDQIVQAVAVPPERGKLLAELGLEPRRQTLFVFGGSQGAAFINGLLEREIGSLSDTPLQIVHITGQSDNSALENRYRAAGIPAVVKGYDEHIERLYAAADLVVCRAGGATIAELSLFAKPAILIPIPNSPLDHQRLNAKVLADAGAAVMLEQSQAADGTLARLIQSFFDEPKLWNERAASIRQFGTPRAAADIVSMIFSEMSRLHTCG